MAFPTTSVLDDFNRGNEGPPPSVAWGTGSIDTSTSTLKVVSNKCVDDATTFTGGYYGTSYGPDCECYVTLATLMTDTTNVDVFVRLVDQGTADRNGYEFRYTRDDSKPGGITRMFRLDDSGGETQLGASVNDTSGALAAGDKIGCEAIGSDIAGYRYRAAAWSSILSRSDATYSAAGRLGLRSGDGLNAVAFDDFGGGTIGGAPPAEEFLPRAARLAFT